MGGYRVVVPIAQDLALWGRDEAAGDDYLEALDLSIQTAAEAGLYTIVRLSLLASMLPTGVGPEGDRFAPSLPDAGSIELWAILAQRYAQESAVLFDLFRTPSPEVSDATAAIFPRLTWTVWRHWLLAMLGEIRREHPRALVIAKGLGLSVAGFPLKYSDGSQVQNLIYGVELGPHQPRQALLELAGLGKQEPVGVFDWEARPWDERMAETWGLIMARTNVHWTAAAWRSGPRALVQERRGRLEATPLGRAFWKAFLAPLAPEVHYEKMLRS